MATENPYGVLGKVSLNIRIMNKLPEEVQKKLDEKEAAAKQAAEAEKKETK